MNMIIYKITQISISEENSFAKYLPTGHISTVARYLPSYIISYHCDLYFVFLFVPVFIDLYWFLMLSSSHVLVGVYSLGSGVVVPFYIFGLRGILCFLLHMKGAI